MDILLSQKERFEKPAYKRSIVLNPDKPKIQAITGPRRAGKSSLLKLTIADLLDKGIPWDQICYVSLEDERLRGQPFEADTLLQAFAELYPGNPLLKNVYFLFDEIQYLNQWEFFVNRIHEQIRNRLPLKSETVLFPAQNLQSLYTTVL